MKIERMRVIEKSSNIGKGRNEVLRFLDDFLNNKLTGEIIIKCYKGGVSKWRANIDYFPADGNYIPLDEDFADEEN